MSDQQVPELEPFVEATGTLDDMHARIEAIETNLSQINSTIETTIDSRMKTFETEMKSTLDIILDHIAKSSSNQPPPVTKSVSDLPTDSTPVKLEKFSDFVKDIDDGEDESSEEISRDRNSRILSAYDTPYGAKNLDGRRKSKFLKPIIDYDDLLEKARDADMRSKTQIVSANMPSDKVILENSLATLNPNAIIKWLKKAHALQQDYPHTKVS